MTTTPLRDAVAREIRLVRLTRWDESKPSPDGDRADEVLRIVADYIEASVLSTTDARKRTILTGLADRIARGAL